MTVADQKQGAASPMRLHKREPMIKIRKIAAYLCLGVGTIAMSTIAMADTLESALVAAYMNNTEIKEAMEKVKAADEHETQARAGYRPTLTANASVVRSDQNISGDQIDFARTQPIGANGIASKVGNTSKSGTLSVQQNIFQGGATAFAIQKAQAEIKAARAALTEVEQRVLLDTVVAYVNLLTKTKEVEFLKTNENTKGQTLKATRDKYNVGEETSTSVAQGEADYADAQARHNTAKAELIGIMATYERLTNKKAGVLGKIEEPRFIPPQIQSAIDKAVLGHPTILRTMFEEKMMRHGIDQTNGGLLPTVDIFASTGRTESGVSSRFNPAPSPAQDQFTKNFTGTTDNRVGVQLKWNIYDGGVIRSQKREGAQNAEQKRHAIETARRQITEQLYSVWEIYKASKENVVKYNQQVKANRIGLDGTEQELKVGSKILLDVLNAQSRLVESQLNLVRAESNYYKAAYQIVALMGLLTAKDMSLKVEHYDPTVHYENVRYKW